MRIKQLTRQERHIILREIDNAVTKLKLPVTIEPDYNKFTLKVNVMSVGKESLKKKEILKEYYKLDNLLKTS